MRDTWPLLQHSAFPRLRRARLETLQLNLGYRCNLSCIHCHVGAGPRRTETMTRATMALALEFARRQNVKTLDLTGGSPEMNPEFRWLVERARADGLHVMDRCNPTILEEDGYEGLAGFLAAHDVEVVASLPCYTEDNVDRQRGAGAFDASIRGLRQLNALGYGREASALALNLVYNALGASLPPPQAQLEADYKRMLGDRFGITFNRLYTITNMPIQRFGALLLSRGEYEGYMALLKQAYAPENLAAVMCRTLISVDWEGRVYDCDFNQMLRLGIGGAGEGAGPGATHLRDLLDADLEHRPIAVADHCWGCAAGQGSSCGGALTGSVVAAAATGAARG